MVEATQIGVLLTQAPAQRGRAAHVAAASGLVRCGQKLYVVADDETALAVFDVGDPSRGHFERLAGDDLPLEHAERKALKPDLEALAETPAGLLAIGSGATSARERGWLWALRDGELDGEPSEVSLSELYAELRPNLHELNIEGLAIASDRMWLAQRGNGAEGANLLIELDLPRALSALSRGELSADVLLERRSYELGDIEGVPLTFTDLAPGPGGQLLFTAAAEDTDSTYYDGECVGAAVGRLDPRAGELLGMWRLSGRLKVEGVTTAADGSLLLVADADDAAQPAPLLRASLPG